jgi:hypothetical protein
VSGVEPAPTFAEMQTCNQCPKGLASGLLRPGGASDTPTAAGRGILCSRLEISSRMPSEAARRPGLTKASASPCTSSNRCMPWPSIMVPQLACGRRPGRQPRPTCHSVPPLQGASQSNREHHHLPDREGTPAPRPRCSPGEGPVPSSSLVTEGQGEEPSQNHRTGPRVPVIPMKTGTHPPRWRQVCQDGPAQFELGLHEEPRRAPNRTEARNWAHHRRQHLGRWRNRTRSGRRCDLGSGSRRCIERRFTPARFHWHRGSRDHLRNDSCHGLFMVFFH